MKKLLVKIKLFSIKKNPDAGNTVSHVSQPISMKFICKSEHLPKELVENQNCIITEVEFSTEGPPTKHGVINGVLTTDVLEKLAQVPYLEFHVERSVVSFNHMPLPDYLYEHKSAVPLYCQECEKFLEMRNTNYGKKVHVICDCCGHSNHWKLKFETIERALIRKNKHHENS